MITADTLSVHQKLCFPDYFVDIVSRSALFLDCQ